MTSINVCLRVLRAIITSSKETQQRQNRTYCKVHPEYGAGVEKLIKC